MSNVSTPQKEEQNRADHTTRRAILTGAVGMGAAAAMMGKAAAQDAEPAHELAGKTAFVTGAARGIGRACAEALAAGGANVVLFDIAKQIPEVPYPLATMDDLESAKQAVETHGVGAIAIAGDVRDFTSQKEAVDQTISQFGSLDIVVANAGITQIGALESFDEDALSLVIDINLKGVIKTVQAVTPILRDRGSGRILIMSSVTGRYGSARFPVYSSTKWAVIGLTKSTALALGPHNVTCNAICPTLVHTKLLDNDHILSNIVPGQTLTFEQLNEGAKGRHILPVGLYEPSRVGDCVRFLSGPGADLISGDVFDIGAGLNARFPA